MKPLEPSIDPDLETEYWRTNHAGERHGALGSYEEFEPAYSYAIGSFSNSPVSDFDAAEPGLASGWESARGESSMSWEHAKQAVKSAWDRMFHAHRSTASDDPVVHDTGVGT